MIDSVKDFLQVYEDTTYKVACERERTVKAGHALYVMKTSRKTIKNRTLLQ